MTPGAYLGSTRYKVTDEYITDFKTSEGASEGVNMDDDILKIVCSFTVMNF